MALSKVDKTLNAASRIVANSAKMLEAMEAWRALKDEVESGGLSFSDTDFLAALANSSIKHATADLLNAAIGNGAALYEAMISGGTIAAFTDDAFQALRP